MDAIFMISKNSETSDPHRFITKSYRKNKFEEK